VTKPKHDATRALLEDADASLLELVDNVLTKGVVIHGEIVLGLADVDLIYLRVSALLCAADRVLGRGR
jgi:gas vesicle protein GvpA/GvpJ/GvpM family